MIARMATYRSSGDPHELARQAERGVLPLFQEQPGFRAYSLATDGSDILSLSVWDSRAEAEAGNAAVADWVRDNMNEQIELTDMRFAEILLSTTLGISTSVGATA
jgi:heme-degrading monooxygenase HmoA